MPSSIKRRKYPRLCIYFGIVLVQFPFRLLKTISNVILFELFFLRSRGFCSISFQVKPKSIRISTNFEVHVISSDKVSVSYPLINHYVFMICLTNSPRNFVWHKSDCFGTAAFSIDRIAAAAVAVAAPRLLFESEFGHKQNCYREKVYFYHLAPIHIRACIPFQFFDARLPIINGTIGSPIATYLSLFRYNELLKFLFRTVLIYTEIFAG